MANYTIQLGDILKNLILNNAYTKASDLVAIEQDYDKLVKNPVAVVEQARTLFFDSTFIYPLYDITHKAELEKKILYHYYNYEIGVEMPDAFKFNMLKTLNEIMPYYNKIYKAVANEYDFDVNIDIREEIDNNGTQEAENESKSNLSSTDKDEQNGTYTDKLRRSDTPQNELTDIDNGKYVSEYNSNNGTNTNTKTNNLISKNDASGKNSGSYQNEQERTLKGTNNADKSLMLMNYIKAIQNVDMMVIEALKSNFMLLW